jgi:hypothetical protein
MEERFAFKEGGEGNLIRANQFIGPSPSDNVAGAPVLPSLAQRAPLAGPGVFTDGVPAVGPVAGFLAAIVGCNLLCRQCVGMMLIIRSRMRLPAGAISLVRLRHRPLAAFGAWLPRFP